MRLVVTGASGFVGRALCREASARGHDVVAVVRRREAAPLLATPLVVDDLGDLVNHASQVAGADALVHLAARVHVMRDPSPDPPSAFRRVNVDGTAATLRLASDAGIGRFVFVSSVKADVGGGRPGADDPYGQSKSEAEQLVRGGDAVASPVIVRPPLVYGPGVGGNFRRLEDLCRLARRIPLPLAGIDNRRSLVYVENLADALLFLAARDDGRSTPYYVSDGEDVSTPELVRAMGRAAGFEPRLFHVPGAALDRVARVVGMGGVADRLFGSLTVDTADLQALGWRPPYTLSEGLARMYAAGSANGGGAS